MNDTSTTTELPNGQHYVFPDNMPTLQHRIDKANRRLDRNGVTERFTYAIVGTEETKRPYGTVVTRNIVEINTPTIAVLDPNGARWEFVAALDIVDGGTMVRTVPGQTLDGLDRPDAHRCDHCGVRRNRAKSYIVRNEITGEHMQVGSSCLQLFFGLTIHGLWTLGMFDADDLADMEAVDDEYGYRGGCTPVLFDTRTMIAIAYVITNGGKGFRSRTTAQEYGSPSTADDVVEIMTYRPSARSPERNAYVEQTVREATALLADNPEIVDSILAYPETMGMSDYADNARVAARSVSLPYRGVGVLVSLVGVWHRANSEAVEREREASTRLNEHVGEVKERLRGLHLTVTNMYERETDWGTSTFMIMMDADGRTFTWKSSATYSWDVGTEIILTATVKDHSEYRGTKQTVLTRGKIDKIVK